MSFFKRSIVSVRRNPLRSLVIFFIVFVLGSMVSASIASEVSANKLVENVQSSLTYSAKLSENDNLAQLMPDLFTTSPLTYDKVQLYGSFTGVKSYDYSLRANWKTPVLENGKPLLIDTALPEFAYRLDDLNIIGTDAGNIPGFETGTLVITEGAMFTEKAIKEGSLVTLIPENIAINNNLGIGDYLYFENSFYTADKMNDIGVMDVDQDSKVSDLMKIEIVGIYALSSGNAGRAENLIDEYQQIYMPNLSIQAMETQSIEFLEYIQTFVGTQDMTIHTLANGQTTVSFSESYLFSRPTTSIYNGFTGESWYDLNFVNYYIGYQVNVIQYFLEDSSQIQPFIDFVEEDSSGQLVAVGDVSTFEAILAPIKMVSMIATFTKILVLVGMIFMLSMVTQLFVNQRQYEIGVYLSIGEKRWKIIGQLLLETFIVASIALVLTTQTGLWLSKMTSSQMIQTQLEDYRTFDWVGSSGSTSDMVVSQVEDKFTITLSPEYLTQYISLGLVVISLSTVIPILFVMRLKPKEIML